MTDFSISSTFWYSAIFSVSAIFLTYVLHLVKNTFINPVPSKNVKTKPGKDKEHHQSGTAKAKKQKGNENKWLNKSEKQIFNHTWLLSSLKGHTDQILDMDYSSNGKYIVSSSEDRTVMIWCIKDILNKDRKSLRVNIEFGYASLVKWSPDTKAFIICKSTDNNLEVYKVDKKKDCWIGPVHKALTFPKVHTEDIIALDISSTGRFIMTCSNKTALILWDLKGHELARVDTYLMNTICAKISPCGKYVVASGFAPDVKVWEVTFNKNGEFLHIKRIFELTGHKSGVYDVAFDVDTSHMATVSKDGTWKIFNTKIEYKKGEDPHLKITGNYNHIGENVHIALSPNGEVVVISCENDLHFFSAKTGVLDCTIENVYPGPITSILFDATGNYLFVSGEKQIRIFHNVTGYKCNIVTAKEKLKQNITSAMKERLQQIIAKSQKFLQTIKA